MLEMEMGKKLYFNKNGQRPVVIQGLTLTKSDRLAVKIKSH